MNDAVNDAGTTVFLPNPVTVGGVRPESAEVITLEIPSRAIPEHRPGQFNMLYAFGIGEVPISISNAPGEDCLWHTIRAVGSVSQALAELKPDDTVGIRGPFGSGWPVDAAESRDIVMVAGGLGLAPLRPLIDTVIRQRDRFGKLFLAIGGRTPEDLIFSSEFERWQAHMKVAVSVDRAGPDWTGNVGLVTELLPRFGFDAARSAAFLCGPEIMMRAGALKLRHLGVGKRSIFVSLERNMKCAVGQCGRCQFGSAFVCRDGPVFSYDRIGPQMHIREL